MSSDRSTQSTPTSASRKVTRNPPTRRAALVGGIVGIGIGLGSHFLLLDHAVVSLTICLLYSIGGTLMIDYLSILRQTPSDGGSWWAIAFGATTGLVVIVVQLVYRPAVHNIEVLRILPEGVITIPFNLILLLWLLLFGVAFVSLTYGMGMAVTDMSEG